MQNTIIKKRNNKKEKKKVNHKKRIYIRAAVFVVLSLILFGYFFAVNCLVSAALIPSYMAEEEFFEDITEECFAEQVQTEDIETNRQEMLEEADDWFADTTGVEVERESDDGYKLIAEEFEAHEDSHKWVLLMHGYTGWKEEMYPFAAWYYKQGFNVLAPDLRCQGDSDGDFIGMGWTDHFDCMMWVDYILSQDKDAEIVLHGQSMGAATALIMTGDKLPDNVKMAVSDCSYTDAFSMFSEKVKEWFYLPSFPVVDTARLLLKLRGGYDLKDASAIDAVRKSTVPTLFIHGDEDAMISVQMTKDLYDAAACDKEILIVKGAGHAQSQDKSPDKYFDAVKFFIDTYVK